MGAQRADVSARPGGRNGGRTTETHSWLRNGLDRESTCLARRIVWKPFGLRIEPWRWRRNVVWE